MGPDRGGALEGIRVLDLGILVQGPQAAQLLRDLGADVIKIELPEFGDMARWIPISLEDLRAPFFVGCNRGKRSLTLDLRREEGRGVLLKLIAQADVMISNFLPGTLERWGLGYEELREKNPRLVYASGSTFGPAGPDSDRKGADLAAQAAGGLIQTTGYDTDSSTPVGVTIADHIGSQNMANGILAALLVRERTGRGQRVDVSLIGGQIYAQASEYTYTFMTGQDTGRSEGGHALIEGVYGLLPTSDGRIAIVGVEALGAFLELVDRSELAGDERFNGLLLSAENRQILFDLLAPTFMQKTTAEWEIIFREADIRCAAVRTHLEVTRDEGVFENGYLQRFEQLDGREALAVGCPIRMSDTPTQPGKWTPELGQHTEEILL
ncbi:CoA transferase, partial [Myxococcota bacterium]|nr:CoA transferase [Myxococcota bacterium]